MILKNVTQRTLCRLVSKQIFRSRLHIRRYFVSM